MTCVRAFAVSFSASSYFYLWVTFTSAALVATACSGRDPGEDRDAAIQDASLPDAQPDGTVGPDGTIEGGLYCYLAHLVPIADPAAPRTHVRVWLSESSGEEVLLEEMDEVLGGAVQRTLPMTLATLPGTGLHPSFGFDGDTLPGETALCDSLPPVDAFYFEMRGTVGGRPATGRCGFGPGEGGWPPKVRVACGELPFVDGAILNVYRDPIAPPPGTTQIMLELRLSGPATSVMLSPVTLSGVLLGQTASEPVNADPWELLDLRADDPSTGPAFDGSVPAAGRAVYLTLWGQTSLGADFCMEGLPDPFTQAPLLYVEGAGTSSLGSFTWITAGYSCSTQALDMDHALP